MGGIAFLIHGQLSDAAIEAASRPGLVGRLLGKSALRTAEYGRGKQLLTLPPGALRGLTGNFLGYLHRVLPNPWPASAQEIEYVKMASTIYLRGERSGGQTDWYVQYSLTGCAGMAEVSAELGFHWLSKWYASEASSISESFFTPLGFRPTSADEDTIERLFLPIAECGHAAFSAPTAAADAESAENEFFEIDASAEEALGDDRATAMKQLQEVCGSYRRTGQCCCQLCQPALDLSYSSRLSCFRQSK